MNRLNQKQERRQICLYLAYFNASPGIMSPLMGHSATAKQEVVSLTKSIREALIHLHDQDRPIRASRLVTLPCCDWLECDT